MNQDLNLLRVFDVLLEERSVTRTGARLGLTQSAVSHALNRLRYMLGDELFARGPGGMQPTPRAVEMGPQVHAALNQLQAALAPSDFDPATSEPRFAAGTRAHSAPPRRRLGRGHPHGPGRRRPDGHGRPDPPASGRVVGAGRAGEADRAALRIPVG